MQVPKIYSLITYLQTFKAFQMKTGVEIYWFGVEMTWGGGWGVN